jgi:hypothetical protein
MFSLTQRSGVRAGSEDLILCALGLCPVRFNSSPPSSLLPCSRTGPATANKTTHLADPGRPSYGREKLFDAIETRQDAANGHAKNNQMVQSMIPESPATNPRAFLTIPKTF